MNYYFFKDVSEAKKETYLRTLALSSASMLGAPWEEDPEDYLDTNGDGEVTQAEFEEAILGGDRALLSTRREKKSARRNPFADVKKSSLEATKIIATPQTIWYAMNAFFASFIIIGTACFTFNMMLKISSVDAELEKVIENIVEVDERRDFRIPQDRADELADLEKEIKQEKANLEEMNEQILDQEKDLEWLTNNLTALSPDGKELKELENELLDAKDLVQKKGQNAAETISNLEGIAKNWFNDASAKKNELVALNEELDDIIKKNRSSAEDVTAVKNVMKELINNLSKHTGSHEKTVKELSAETRTKIRGLKDRISAIWNGENPEDVEVEEEPELAPSWKPSWSQAIGCTLAVIAAAGLACQVFWPETPTVWDPVQDKLVTPSSKDGYANPNYKEGGTKQAGSNGQCWTSENGNEFCYPEVPLASYIYPLGENLGSIGATTIKMGYNGLYEGIPVASHVAKDYVLPAFTSVAVPVLWEVTKFSASTTAWGLYILSHVAAGTLSTTASLASTTYSYLS